MSSTAQRPYKRPRFSNLRGLLDRWKTRPIAIVVFAGSVVLMLSLDGLSSSRVLAPAVARALAVEHPAPTVSYVESVHVHLGDEIDEGAPLVTLSSEMLDRELAQVEAELQSLRFRMEWELARIRIERTRDHNDVAIESARATRDLGLADAQERHRDTLSDLADEQTQEVQELVDRNLSSTEDLSAARLEEARADARAELERRSVRLERQYQEAIDELLTDAPSADSIEDPALSYFEAELEVLMQRRHAILEDLDHLVVLARSGGRIERVLSVGSAVSIGTSVASVIPVEPCEVVAYLPPDTLVQQLPVGTEATVSVAGRPCPEHSRVLRLGATVEQAPGQVTGVLQTPVFGFPVYISVPADCPLSVGQSVSVELMARLQ